MKNLILFLIILTSCNTKTEEKNNLENFTWKFCGEIGHISDILIFSKKNLYVKNDSIYFHNSKSLIGIIDSVKYYYGERRLYVKDLNGNVGRYCEQ